MTKVLKIAALIVSAACLGAAAHSENNIRVDLQSLLGILMYNYDAGRFLGEFNTTLYGLGGGEITAAIENADGKKVFEHKFPCVNTYGDENTPACFTDSSSQKDKLKPYDVQNGEHTLRLTHNGKEFYTLKFNFRTVTEYDYKSVYVTGEWEKAAILELSASPAIRVGIYIGSPETCGGAGVNAQAHLYRNGVFVAKGHIEGIFYEACSTNQVVFPLFSEDDAHFTKWMSATDILENDGAYEVRFFKDKNPVKTYGFTVSGGRLTTTPPEGIQTGLKAEKLRAYQPDTWIYVK